MAWVRDWTSDRRLGLLPKMLMFFLQMFLHCQLVNSLCMRSVQKDWDLVGGCAHARITRTRTHACPHGGSAPCLGAEHQ